ncbi:MAG: hypothetical protein L0Z62_35870 [Gemmataceae bacterium]|nr:hypothetical protein [Gemmataceae bacterium]
MMEVSYCRTVLREARFEVWMMNSEGEEKWRSNSRTVLLLPSGQWALYVTKTGRRVSEGQGHVALERAIADPTLGADVRDLVRPK